MAGLVDFTDEEEVKEYLKNTEIEFMFGCHKEHQEDSCYRLGEFLETIRKKFTEAASVYKNCCDQYQNATCCYKLGQYHMLGKGGMLKSQLEAYKAYHTACNQEKYRDQGKNDRIAASCTNLGILLSQKSLNDDGKLKLMNSMKNDLGKTDAGDLNSEIERVFKKACSLNDKTGCNFLSQLYLTGFGDESKSNYKLAAHYADRACDLGDPSACHNLVIMHTRGDGVEKNETKSKEYEVKRDELVKQTLSLKFGEE